MKILNIQTDFAGQIGVKPRRPKIYTDATLNEILTAGFLNSPQAQGYTFYPDDLIDISYANNTSQTFTIASITNGVITLQVANSAVILPVVSGHVPVFSGTTGNLADSGFALADVNGDFIATTIAGEGKTGKIAYYVNDNGFLDALDTVDASRVFYGDINEPDVGSNIFWVQEGVSAAALSGGGVVPIFTPTSGTAGYQVREILISAGGTNFSGGGGDRLIAISDGVSAYTIIPETVLQSLVNARWGSTSLPFPAFSQTTPTAPGNVIRAVYTGGAADYSAGVVVVTLCLQRIV